MQRPEAALDGVRIVLVRPRGPANVGAVARAMKNMGLHRLTLVQPAPRCLARAGLTAVHARDVLTAAQVVDSLGEAVADCHLVVGTTCRGGPYRAAADVPEALAPLILARAAGGAAALVFGPEDRGLTNEDLKHCQHLIAIDSSADYASLNLAQAVLLCCYELRRATPLVTAVRAAAVPATAETTELLYERLRAALLRIGFLNPQNPDHIMLALRRLLGRAGLDDSEVRLLLGLARQIDWYAHDGWRREPRDASEQVG